MDAKLYVLMDWAAVEELVYSESSNPHEFLGPHPVSYTHLNTMSWVLSPWPAEAYR